MASWSALSTGRPEIEDERALVQRAARFAFDSADRVFRLSVERALWCRWERVGQPGTRPIREVWRSARGERVQSGLG